MAAEYEVNIKINSQEIERELGKIDRTVAKIGKPKGGGSRRKPGIAGLLPSSEQLRAAEKGLVQLTAKTKAIQSIQDKFSERRTRALMRSNALNEKELRINKQLTAEARARLRLLSQAGAKGFDGTRPQGRQMAESINALTNAQEKRARLANKINEMEAKGLNVQKLREKLGKATTEQSARRFASATKEFRLLEKTIRLEESKLRILREQQKGFASSPVRGTRTMMGSPAQISAAGRQRVSPIGGRIDIAGSPAQMEAIRKVEMAEMRADKKAHFAELRLIQQRQKIQLDNVDKLFRANERELEKFNRKLEAADRARQNRLTGANAGRGQFGPAAPPVQGPRQMIASPIGGAINIPGSPAFLRRQQRIKTLEQVGLGAGFPLLFGGGAGSVLGGGLGGLTGSFGAQIAFSAIGQQIDQFVAGMVDAGKALTSVGGAADFMAEKSLFSSDKMQFRIEKLIEEGRVTEAAALMTQEMAKQVGGSGLKALKDLGTEASKMGKIFSTLLIRVQAFLAKALTPLLKLINSAVGGLTAQSQLDQMIAEAGSPERGAAILARSRELRGNRVSARTGKVVGLKQLTPEVIQTLQEEFPASIPEGAAIEPTVLETLRAADSTAGKGAKDQQRLADIARRAQERLQIMQQEGDLAKELKKLDFERAAEIEKINKLEFASTEAREDAIEKTNQLFDAQKGEAIGKALGKDLQTAIALKKAQEDVLRPLEDQRRLLEAKLKGNEEEVRLNLQVESIMRSVKGLKKEDVENVVKGNALLKEQVAVVEKLDQVYASIGQSITTGIVDALTSAVEGTKSLADVAGQTLRQVANILLQFGVQSTLSGIPGLDKFFPGRALGGSVSANKPYMVGERGPELFVPGAQGNVVPNNAIGGANVVVNVDASGSQAQGNQPNAKALGAAIGAAVQAELVKQKRPGGLLS